MALGMLGPHTELFYIQEDPLAGASATEKPQAVLSRRVGSATATPASDCTGLQLSQV